MNRVTTFVCALAVLVLGAAESSSADVLMFDDITTATGCCTDIPANYGGLTWSDSFGVLNPTAGYTCTAPGSLDTHLCYAAWRSSYSSRASIGV